jgi:hypothetical protein
MEGINKFSKIKWNREAVVKNAQKFSKEEFVRGVKRCIKMLSCQNSLK